MRPLQTAFTFAPAAAHLPAEDDLGRLARGLGERIGEAIEVILTDNGRVMISAHQEQDHICLRLHHMFLAADGPTLDALAGYLQGDPESGAALDAFVQNNREAIRRRPKRRTAILTSGRHHDLVAMREDLAADYFDDNCSPRITWGRRTTGRRRSIKLGSYSPRTELIRIHPVLDSSWVPGYFVQYVVYHEMLHHVLGAEMQGTRRRFHTPEFREFERRFARYAEAVAWEQKNLRRLLRS